MANGALFIGWGGPVRGREAKSLEVFNEGMQYWTRLRQTGQIESFEPVALEPHGGDLFGFVLIRGDRDKLNQLRYSEEWIRLNDRAAAVVDGFGLVTAFVGEDLQRLFANYQTNTSDLTA
ncbi:MAG: hypothetical protein JOZ81_10795 [Chloroflexi bacterium]|nr:hypothetical protein [Chloroflexota bacterium]